MRILRWMGVVAALVATLVGTTATAASANPSAPLLGPGFVTRGSGVECVQQAYNFVAGRGLTVDGRYGQATYDATRDFQAIFGLARDGIVGPETGEAIMFAVNSRAGHDAWRSGGCWNVVPSRT